MRVHALIQGIQIILLVVINAYESDLKSRIKEDLNGHEYFLQIMKGL